ncbi:uncharacterized protein LOC122651565 isoform X2 [Telopea speciosissima]|uniref:uncharacterized protein LOC122651565 isoform X2 n=1 Tax=Telopea speciosissima TaxID=54955 RepID=UPI001CC3687F|nr:uncharacterized protein LOC122651565 isoform X2 [Telopea speciosissima]
MGKLSSMISFLCNFTFLFLILVFCLLFGSLRADFPNPFKDVGCHLISCGEGTCKSSSNSFLGFECECNLGWKKIQIGSLSFPSCVVPNCTVDFECGSNTTTPSPPPPPPPASLLPPLNSSDPCALTWCGDGTCIANGTGHICSCHEGSSNLFNRTNLSCFKQCSLGGDCTSLGFNLPSPSSTSSSSSSSPVSVQNGMPPPSPSSSDSTDSTRNGATGKPNCWRTQLVLTMSLITAISIYSA